MAVMVGGGASSPPGATFTRMSSTITLRCSSDEGPTWNVRLAAWPSSATVASWISGGATA